MSATAWGAITVERVDPSSWLVLATGVAAALAVVVDAVWRWSRGVVTIAHEAGHAVAAIATGRRLTGIRLHSDTSGLTLSVGRPRGFGMIVTAAAGYVSPSLVGLAGVALLAVDRVTVMLWAAAAVLVAMLVMVRNLYGALTLVVTGGAVVGVSLYGPEDVQAVRADEHEEHPAVDPVHDLQAVREQPHPLRPLDHEEERAERPGQDEESRAAAGVAPSKGSPR